MTPRRFPLLTLGQQAALAALRQHDGLPLSEGDWRKAVAARSGGRAIPFQPEALVRRRLVREIDHQGQPFFQITQAGLTALDAAAIGA